jgi:hypothetical protein
MKPLFAVVAPVHFYFKQWRDHFVRHFDLIVVASACQRITTYRRLLSKVHTSLDVDTRNIVALTG